MTSYLDLPLDLHLIFISYLNPKHLSCLAQTCRQMYKLVEEHGWSTYRRVYIDDSMSPSMDAVFQHWNDRTRVAHFYRASLNFQEREFTAKVLCSPWSHIFHPVMSLSRSRLAVAAGNALLTFAFDADEPGTLRPSRISLETRVGLPRATSRNGKKDIIGIAFVPDREGEDRTLVAALGDGTIERLYLPAVDPSSPVHDSRRVIFTAMYERGPKELNALAARGQLVVVLARSGQTAMYRANAPWQAPSLLSLPGPRFGRSWCAHIGLNSSYVAFGRSHVEAPLALHSLRPDGGISPVFSSLKGAPPGKNAAVYALADMGRNMLLSGWFDGIARAYDLRAPATTPALSLRDPWAPDALFSVSAAGNLVAAGSARHGLVTLFDVRMPRDGFSVYAPGRAENSPVYALSFEETRVFALTRTRAYAIDFSRGTSGDIFPELGGEALVQYNVVRYEHSKGR